MAATSQHNGHPTTYNWDTQQWLYTDTQEPETQIRPCLHCGLSPTKEGYDACIGYLPNVMHACCGHNVRRPYAMFNDKTTIYFKDLVEMKSYFRITK
jgi:hypothetical protein